MTLLKTNALCNQNTAFMLYFPLNPLFFVEKIFPCSWVKYPEFPMTFLQKLDNR